VQFDIFETPLQWCHRGRGIITQSAFETQITEDIEKEKRNILILR